MTKKKLLHVLMVSVAMILCFSLAIYTTAAADGNGGNITVTVASTEGPLSVPVPVTLDGTETTADAVATKIRTALASTSLDGYTVGGSDDVITITADVAVEGEELTISFADTDTTGVTATSDSVLGVKEVTAVTAVYASDSFDVLAACSTNGDITVTVASTVDSLNVPVPVTLDTSTHGTVDAVANAIKDALDGADITGYTVSCSGAIVTITANAAVDGEVITMSLLDAGVTGVDVISGTDVTGVAEVTGVSPVNASATLTVTKGVDDVGPTGPILGDVFLITGDVIEIDYNEPVLSDEDAHDLFIIEVDGQEADWEFLSYFDFGPYGERGGVVNVRLEDELDIGQIRARCRESAANAEYDRTEDTVGPAAAALITVGIVDSLDQPVEAVWKTFYSERSQGYMSRFWTYASREAGSNGSVLFDHSGTINANNVFSDPANPKYTDEYVARMVGEGTNKFLGRGEYLNLPMIYAGYKALIVGPTQSVYEAPEYRELYVYGETDDTYTRTMIKATFDGNFDPTTGEYQKPYIVGTSDDIMRHYAPIKEDGTTATGNGDSARPKSDHFYFGEAFFDIAYELAVVQGSQSYPLTEFNNPNDYRFDLQLEEAYNKAIAADKWQGTRLMDSVKDYYIFGNMAFQEFIPESLNFEYESFPVNTRQEVYEYDYPLYWALSGIHGKWCFWAGKGNAQTSHGSNDSSKVNTPWWWRNQPDNFTYANAITGSVGKAHDPLQIVRAEVTGTNQIRIYFNREVSTIAATQSAANYLVYIDGREVTPTMYTNAGYAFRGVTLNTAGAANALARGPFGRDFSGFTQKDLDERSVANGGWIDNDQSLGTYALEKGQYVGLEDAIRDYGAGLTGTIEVAYVGMGANPVKDWNGNEMVKDQKFEAEFKPVFGHAYRSPLGGVYVYLDSWTAEGQIGDIDGDGVIDKGYYSYRNEPSQPTAKDVAMAAGHQYDAICTNNSTITYPTSAGGADFDKAFGTGTGSQVPTTGTYTIGAYTWNNGTVTTSGGSFYNTGNTTITNGPVTYDRPGLRLADGFTRGGGGIKIAAGSVLGQHNGVREGTNSVFNGSDLGENLRVEGWGGTQFQTEDVGVLRDFNLSRYRNESLVFHEGGHGVDSVLQTYQVNVTNDINAAYCTATAAANGVRYVSVDGVVTYVGSRGEYVSTCNTFFNSTMREQFEGKVDNTWTPVSNRIEYFQYDPYGMEAFKRLQFNGDLKLWYDNDVGNPSKRVIPEDWTLLRDLGQTNPAYAFAKDWTSENDLIAWGLGVPITARENPYTGWHNPLIKWTSYSGPSIWKHAPYKEPTRTNWMKDIRFDSVGDTPYYPNPDGSQSFKNLEHPFFYDAGVPMPTRTVALEELVTPVSGQIVADSPEMISKVLIAFELEDYSGEVNMNNAANSFSLKVDGQPMHFYFWEFDDSNPDFAKVTLRVDWPLDENAVIEVLAAKASAEVNLDANGGSVSPTKITVVTGEAYGTLPTPTHSDYSFNGWYTSLTGGTEVTSSSIVPNPAPSTLYARWSQTPVTFTVSFNANGGSGSQDSVEVEQGDNYTLPANPFTRNGYTFNGWKVDNAGSTLAVGASITVDADITLYAQWGSRGSSSSSSSSSSNNASLSTTKATFNADDGKDVSVTLSLNGKTLKGLKNGSYTLKEGTDYTVSGNTVTLSKEYLATLPVGTYTIDFEMSSGTNPKVTVTISGVVEDQPTVPAYQPMAPTHSAGTQIDAGKTNNALVLNGETTELPAVKISGYNWLKLRDFAALLKGSSKQFAISYDAATGIIDLRTGQAYQPLGDELTDTLADMEKAVASLQQIRVDGKFIDIAAYNINGYNYFRLRDLAIILDFAVQYDDANGQITLDFNKPYSE